ncbi:MAG: hypothetical protein ACRBDL_08520 [Alphaproteobacteria bacterium]
MTENNDTPNRTESVDLGLVDSYKVGFSDALRMGVTWADKTLLGDTNHGAYAKILGALVEPEAQTAMAEGGATHVFLEYPQGIQPLVNQFQRHAAKTDQSENFGIFTKKFMDYRVSMKGDTWKHPADKDGTPTEGASEDFLENYMAPFIQNATHVGIKVHLLDDLDGLFEQGAVDFERQKLNRYSDEIKEIKEKMGEDDPRAARKIERLQGKIDKRLPGYVEDYQKFLLKRNDDEDTAQTVNKAANGEKAVILYGGVHGARHDDFEEHLDGKSLKIDIAVSRAEYEGFYAGAMDKFNRFLGGGGKADAVETPSRFGEDPADLVYFLDEGVLSTTVNTPPELVQKLNEMAAPLPSSEPLPEESANDEIYDVSGTSNATIPGANR